ncbi:MAG TPA: hypothetical protein VH558_02195 [Pseudolabrys sp.]|jgi:hypothetical protein
MRIPSSYASYIAIAETITLILLAVITQRLGYTIIAIFVAAAAWLTLAFVCFVFLMNAWGL